MKYQMSGEVSFRIVVEANSEDEAMELVESDFGILNDDERVDVAFVHVKVCASKSVRVAYSKAVPPAFTLKT